MDKNTILDYVTETPGNTNRAVLESMLDSIEGGSNDILTAHVEFICTEESYYAYSVPCLERGFILNQDILVQYGHSPITVDIPVSENGFVLPLDQLGINTSEPPVLTGSISYDEDKDVFYITGDGTITCKGQNSSPIFIEPSSGDTGAS